MEVSKEMGLRDAVGRALAEDLVIGSVGPVMDEALADYGFKPDVVPAHPKLPVLVRAAAEMAASILARKRRRHADSREPACVEISALRGVTGERCG
jgi:hypothetical protein